MGSGGTGLGIGGAAEAGTTAGAGAEAAIAGGFVAAPVGAGVFLVGGVIIAFVGVMAAGGGVVVAGVVLGGADVLRFGGLIVAAAASPAERGRAAGGVATGTGCLLAGAAAGAAFADGKLIPRAPQLQERRASRSDPASSPRRNPYPSRRWKPPGRGAPSRNRNLFLL